MNIYDQVESSKLDLSKEPSNVPHRPVPQKKITPIETILFGE